MFQTSTRCQPFAVKATLPPMSQPSLQARAIFAGIGMGPMAGSLVMNGSSQISFGPIRWIRK